MAIKIIADVTSGARYRYTPQGAMFVRRFFVEGLDGTAADNCARATIVSDSTTGQTIPPYMSAHPTIPNLIVAGYECWAGGTEQSPNKTGVNVDVLYQSPEFFPGQNITQIEISSIDTTVLLNWWPSGDAKGKPIVVPVQVKNGAIDPAADFDNEIDVQTILNNVGGENNAASKGIYFDYVSVPKLSGGLTMKFMRREDNPPDQTMLKQTNSRKWQGLPAGCWLLRNTFSTQVFAGLGSTTNGWQNTYVFESCTADDLVIAQELGVGGFSRVEFYRDPVTGRTVPGTSFDLQNGWIVVDPYGRVDFNVLKLPTVYT